MSDWWNKSGAAGFGAGVAAAGALVWAILMSPEDARRWIISDYSKSEKIEQALKPIIFSNHQRAEFQKQVELLKNKLQEATLLMKSAVNEKETAFMELERVQLEQSKLASDPVWTQFENLKFEKEKLVTVVKRLGEKVSEYENEIQKLSDKNNELNKQLREMTDFSDKKIANLEKKLSLSDTPSKPTVYDRLSDEKGILKGGVFEILEGSGSIRVDAVSSSGCNMNLSSPMMKKDISGFFPKGKYYPITANGVDGGNFYVSKTDVLKRICYLKFYFPKKL